MKKTSLIMLVFIIIGSLLVFGCIKKGPSSSGTARVISGAGPRILGYSLEQGPGDLFILLCAVEKLVDFNEKQELVPHLAKGYEIDDDTKAIRVTMRKGIKFHDGSDCDAEAVAWNYKQQVANKRIGYLDQWDRLEVVSKYSFIIYYKGEYNNQLENAWLWSPPIYSMAAFVNAGKGDIEKSKEWARLNVSGTGPFKQGEFKRDLSLTMERFDDYWGGKPFLDKIEYTFIPDPMTASLKMQAGEADLWFGVSIKDQLDLEKKGFTRVAGQPSVAWLGPNLKNPKSKWHNKSLREAIEYALDKEGIAAALGFGYYKAAKMIVPEGKWGYDEKWEGRGYNVVKAKKLLKDSGYNGTTIKLLVLTGPNADTATAVKRYLDDIGLNVNVDIADPGRFYGSLFVTGWDDLILFAFGVLGNSLESFHMNLGDQPLTRMGSWSLPPELLQMSKDSRAYASLRKREEAAGKLFMALSEGAYLIPIYQYRSANIVQPGFHTTLGQESGFTQYWARYWLKK